MRKQIFYIISTVFLGVILTSAARAAIFDRIVAVVNNEIITLSELQSFKHARLKDAESVDKSKPQGVDSSDAEKAFLDELIDKKLQLQQAKDKKVDVSQEQVQAALQDLMRQNNISSEEQLVKALSEEGIALDGLKTQIEENIRLAKLVGMEVRSKIFITDDDVAEYYHKHEAEFKREELGARHILFPLAPEAGEAEIKQAEELVKQSRDKLKYGRAGLDFDGLAKGLEAKHSVKSGDLGYFGKGQILPEIEQAIWELPIGEFAIVRTQFGFHLVQVTDRKWYTLSSDPEIKERVRQALYRQRLKQEMDAWVADLHKKASIKVML